MSVSLKCAGCAAPLEMKWSGGRVYCRFCGNSYSMEDVRRMLEAEQNEQAARAEENGEENRTKRSLRAPYSAEEIARDLCTKFKPQSGATGLYAGCHLRPGNDKVYEYAGMLGVPAGEELYVCWIGSVTVLFKNGIAMTARGLYIVLGREPRFYTWQQFSRCCFWRDQRTAMVEIDGKKIFLLNQELADLVENLRRNTGGYPADLENAVSEGCVEREIVEAVMLQYFGRPSHRIWAAGALGPHNCEAYEEVLRLTGISPKDRIYAIHHNSAYQSCFVISEKGLYVINETYKNVTGKKGCIYYKWSNFARSELDMAKMDDACFVRVAHVHLTAQGLAEAEAMDLLNTLARLRLLLTAIREEEKNSLRGPRSAQEIAVLRCQNNGLGKLNWVEKDCYKKPAGDSLFKKTAKLGVPQDEKIYICYLDCGLTGKVYGGIVLCEDHIYVKVKNGVLFDYTWEQFRSTPFSRDKDGRIYIGLGSLWCDDKEFGPFLESLRYELSDYPEDLEAAITAETKPEEIVDALFSRYFVNLSYVETGGILKFDNSLYYKGAMTRLNIPKEELVYLIRSLSNSKFSYGFAITDKGLYYDGSGRVDWRQYAAGKLSFGGKDSEIIYINGEEIGTIFGEKEIGEVTKLLQTLKRLMEKVFAYQ